MPAIGWRAYRINTEILELRWTDDPASLRTTPQQTDAPSGCYCRLGRAHGGHRRQPDPRLRAFDRRCGQRDARGALRRRPLAAMASLRLDSHRLRLHRAGPVSTVDILAPRQDDREALGPRRGAPQGVRLLRHRP